MKKYLLPNTGKYYKANLHAHTTLSDGSLTPEEVKELYKSQGYSILAYTDHGVFIPHNDLTDETFVALNGFEGEMNENTFDHLFVSEKCVHLCFIAKEKDIVKHPFWHRSDYLFGNAINNRHLVQFDETQPDYVREYSGKGICDMIKRGRDNGFFVTYNHPKWSQENFEQYGKYEGMNAMEIYNHGSWVEGFNEYNGDDYDNLLRQGKRIYCIATDDNHNHAPLGDPKCDVCGGFVMINADKLDYPSVIKSLENGHFYASRGPIISQLYYDTEEKKLYVQCSPAKKIIITTAMRIARILTAEARGEEYLQEATFNVSGKEGYIRLTIYDEKGLTADTNAYFIDELLK